MYRPGTIDVATEKVGDGFDEASVVHWPLVTWRCHGQHGRIRDPTVDNLMLECQPGGREMRLKLNNRIGGHITAILLALMCTTATQAEVNSDDPLLDKSRALAQSFGAQLQTALQDALANGGPVEALSVCKDQAPQIASQLSRESGAKVSRTSRRYRNAGNAPEPWEITVLEHFDTVMNAEKPLPEHLERHANGTRYMKAIRTQPVCLGCHGENLSVEVQAALVEHYPHDRAKGYALGDLRGAFSIAWPAPEGDEAHAAIGAIANGANDLPSKQHPNE